MEKTYSGWSNYETWCTNTWISNDEGIYDMVREEVDNSLKNDSEDYEVADVIKGLIEELRDREHKMNFGLFDDLLTASLDVVNWREIAGYYVDEWRENND